MKKRTEMFSIRIFDRYLLGQIFQQEATQCTFIRSCTIEVRGGKEIYGRKTVIQQSLWWEMKYIMIYNPHIHALREKHFQL